MLAMAATGWCSRQTWRSRVPGSFGEGMSKDTLPSVICRGLGPTLRAAAVHPFWCVSERSTAVRVDQLIANHRMRLISVIQSAPSVRAGCRQVQIHPSTYYSWLQRLEVEGVDGLLPSGGDRRVKGPDRLRLEADVVGWSLANPAWGPRRLFYELQRRGVAVGSPSQVWRILKSHHLNQRKLRYRMIATAKGLAEAEHNLGPVPVSRAKPWIGELHAVNPGDLVQMDCFQLGRLKGTRLGVRKQPGMVWQYTAIDVASSFLWAELHATAHNPAAVHTTALAFRVAQDLAEWGWQLKQISTDRGNEFVAHRFTNALADLGVKHRLIAAGRPQSNGKVEQVQSTVLEECWKPSFIRYTEPAITGLRTDLDWFVNDYNYNRPHQGKWNNGKPPAQIIIPNNGNTP